MSKLGKVIKSNIMTPHDKYFASQEKIGEVINTDEERECCDIIYINVDGVPMSVFGVPVKTLGSGIISWFPKVGDKVELKEYGKKLTVTGEAKDLKLMADDTTVNLDFFSNTLSGTTGGFLT